MTKLDTSLNQKPEIAIDNQNSQFSSSYLQNKLGKGSMERFSNSSLLSQLVQEKDENHGKHNTPGLKFSYSQTPNIIKPLIKGAQKTPNELDRIKSNIKASMQSLTNQKNASQLHKNFSSEARG